MNRGLLFILLIFHFSCVWGDPVSKNDLQSVTYAFIERNFPKNKTFSIHEILPVQTEGINSLYIINLIPEGWILVSADDKAEPILGFNFTGSFDGDFQKVFPVNKWISEYDRNISTVLANSRISKNPRWYTLYKQESATENIPPLIEVSWDQDATFNRYCPVDPKGPGGHAYVGCVAVSMAQAMSVFKYPMTGTGTKSYESSRYGKLSVHFGDENYSWDLMSTGSADDYNSRILYTCAVSVSMNFGPNGSGSFVSRIPSAMKSYFKYNTEIKRVTHTGSDSAWIRIIINELKNGRPVIYSGDANDDEAGHAFNIDGVNDGRYFHVNWGWSGAYNGYYLITDLTPGNYDFSKNHEAIINIKPPDIGPYDIQLSRLTIKEGQPAGTYVAKIRIMDKTPDDFYTVDLLGDSIDVNTHAPSDFYVSNDTIRTLKTFYQNDQTEIPVFVRVADQNANFLQKKFIISVVDASYDDEMALNTNSVKVYPNPSSGTIFIEVPEISLLFIDLLDLSGRVVYHNRYINQNNTISLFYPLKGIYILKVSNEKGMSVSHKLVIL